MGPGTHEGKILVMGIFRVKKRIIIPSKRLEERGKIRRVEHWLGQQDQEGAVDLQKMVKRMKVSGETFNVPG